jgi:hypothetical protein
MQIQGFRNDPLLYDFEMPLQAVFYPLGFPLEISTNSREVLKAAKESWGLFRHLFHETSVKLRVGVLDDGSTECPPPPSFRGSRNVIAMVADASNFGICDLDRAVGFCWLSRAALANRAYARYHFLDALGLMLVESRHCTPVHAACVTRDGRSVLLCGESEAGKSSLSLACALHGWTFVSDDVCCVVRNSHPPVVVGNPYRMRFRESAATLFPQLKQRPLIPHGMEFKIEVTTESLPNVAATPLASADYMVFLNRQPSGPAVLSRFPKDDALRYLEHVVCYGSPQLREEQTRSLHSLLTAEILELRYSDLDSAVQRLESMLTEQIPWKVRTGAL